MRWIVIVMKRAFLLNIYGTFRWHMQIGKCYKCSITLRQMAIIRIFKPSSSIGYIGCICHFKHFLIIYKNKTKYGIIVLLLLTTVSHLMLLLQAGWPSGSLIHDGVEMSWGVLIAAPCALVLLWIWLRVPPLLSEGFLCVHR